MQWTKQGQEYDTESEMILQKYKSAGRIAIFGGGILGRDLAPLLESYHIFGGFIDNSSEKQQNGIDGKKVWDASEYLSQYPNGWIVIAATSEHTEEIAIQLGKLGKRMGEDVWEYGEFTRKVFPILSFYYFKKIYVELAQICVTERCTLRCQKCAHACNYVPISADDMPPEEVKRSADCFFKNVDFVKEFVLIGGEPLLYKRLEEAIAYIGERYRGQMLLFAVTTNGTIIPNDTILGLCRKYDVTIRVSDYSATLPKLKIQYGALYKKLQGIRTLVWDTDDTDSWYDYGFESVDHGSDPEILMDVFDRCKTPCREIRGDKYYYCVMARSVSENMKRYVGMEDYFDLSGKVDRKHLFEFEMGHSKKGYLDMCRFCRGADAINYRIPAAVQERRDNNKGKVD